MVEEAARSRLGRGLAALIGDMETETEVVERSHGQRHVPIDLIRPNPRNPRQSFGEEDLRDLSASIREKGVVQPILVRPDPDDAGRYELIAGERRWRAAQLAGRHEIPVVIQEVNDREALELAIVENVQRADLNPLEEATGYQQLIDQFAYTQKELADVIGKSRSHVANTVRLLKLPDAVKAFIADGRLSAGHARTLITSEDPVAMAERIVQAGLSVRDAEELSQEPENAAAKPKPTKSTDTLALEKRLSDALGLTVKITHKDNGSGQVAIKYRTLEQLDEISRRLATV